jgi:transcriptional regulator with XRE-family HTH domain
MRKTLTAARKRYGWKPEDLAKHSGVSRATIYRLEAGTYPSYETVQKLESALRLRRGTLVFGPVAAPEAQAS